MDGRKRIDRDQVAGLLRIEDQHRGVRWLMACAVLLRESNEDEAIFLRLVRAPLSLAPAFGEKNNFPRFETFFLSFSSLFALRHFFFVTLYL